VYGDATGRGVILRPRVQTGRLVRNLSDVPQTVPPRLPDSQLESLVKDRVYSVNGMLRNYARRAPSLDRPRCRS